MSGVEGCSDKIGRSANAEISQVAVMVSRMVPNKHTLKYGELCKCSFKPTVSQPDSYPKALLIEVLVLPLSFLTTQVVCSVFVWGQKVALTKIMVNSPFKQSNVVLFRQSI